MTQEALFRAFPLGGVRRTTCGELPVPYHVYDGQVALIGGWVDAQAARSFLAGQEAQPVLAADGRAMAVVWACDFAQSSLGRHAELQVSLAVSRRPLPAVKAGPFALLRLIALEPELRLFPVGLWSDSERAVCYKREVLGLDACLCQAHLEREEGSAYFSFRFDTEGGGLIAQGDVEFLERQPVWESLWLTNGLGREAMERVDRAPWLSAQVMSPVGALQARSAEAQLYLRAAKTTAVRFNRRSSRLEFGDTPCRDLRFQPAFVECMGAFQLVVLNPYNQGEPPYGNLPA